MHRGARINFWIAIFLWIGIFFLVIGYAQILFYLVFSQIYCYMHRPEKRKHYGLDFPSVSVVISAYNEERVIAGCIRSIFASKFVGKPQVVVVDDGSTDYTPYILDALAKELGIVVIHKANSGKALSMNQGLRKATGEIIVSMDADTRVTPFTIMWLVRNFSDPQVGAVCGYDIPSNANNWLVKLLMLSSHVSTGMVRRALSVLDCVLVVNFGAIRSDILRKIGGYSKSIGEDLEMTFRIHKLGYQVRFELEAIAYSESPETLKVLWHQRVRWFRGYLQVIRKHKDMLFNDRFGLFLVYNFVTTVIFPWFLILSAALFFVALFGGSLSLASIYLIVSFFGLFTSFLVICYSLWEDHNLMKYSPYLLVLPAWIFYSLFLDFVGIYATLSEALGTERKWIPVKHGKV